MNHPNKPYTAQDLMRYVRGEMSPDEQHALEKAALDDSFLSDALEGYLTIPQEEDALATIRESIQSRKVPSEPKIRFLWLKQPLSIAATLAFLLMAGYFMLRKDAQPEQTTVLAENKSEEDQNKQPISPFAENQPSQTLSPKSEAEAIEKSVMPKFEESKNESTPQPNVDAINPPVVVTDNAVQEDIAMASTNSGAVSEMPNNNFSITDNVTESKPEADLAKSEVAVQSKSVETLSVASVPKKANARKSMASSVQKDESALLASDELQFQKYINALSNRICIDANGQALHGDVVLSFNVNRKSRPTDIRVESNFQTDCVEKSKEILLNGPKWDKSIQGRRTVRIRW